MARKKQQYLTKRRRELLKWFRSEAPELAVLYRACLRLLFADERMPGRYYFAAHCVREIRNGLHRKDRGPSRRRAQYVHRLDKIVPVWKSEFKDAGLLDGAQSSSAGVGAPRTVSISIKLVLMLGEMITEHRETRSKHRDDALRFLGSRAVANNWMTLTDWFVKNVHVDEIGGKSSNRKEFIRRFQLFESSLGSAISSFFTTTDELDNVLDKANKKRSR